MTSRRDIRRIAMQVLYQFDVRGPGDIELIRSGLEETSDSDEANAEGFSLAQAAWDQHEKADSLAAERAPDWPTHRQPPIDRAIIRLAYYEIAAGRVPSGIAINEAVVLAKQYCSEQSPGFINAVLDKIAKQFNRRPSATAVVEASKPSSADATDTPPPVHEPNP